MDEAPRPQPVTYHPIGVVRSPHTAAAEVPIQPVYARGVEGRAEILPEFAEGLADVDVLDGTPLLDVKPYIARFDRRDGVRSGWQDRVDEPTAETRGRRRAGGPGPLA